MEEVVVDYFWIIVMFFSALWTLIFIFSKKKIFRVNYSFKYYVHNDISSLGKIVSFFSDFFFLCADYARWIVSVCAKNDDACKMEVSGEH